MRKLWVVLGVVLMGVLGGCEKEGVEGEIVIRFALGDGGYEARGAGLAEAETVVVALGGVVHMYATLEEDGVLGVGGGEGALGTIGANGAIGSGGTIETKGTLGTGGTEGANGIEGALGAGTEGTNGAIGTIGAAGSAGTKSGLRAAGAEVMEMGTKIIIVAYDNSGGYVTEAEYEVTDGSGGIRPTDGSGIGITITVEGFYTFIAYSLNTTSTFSYSDDMGPYSANNAGDDPLWGSSGKVYVSAGMNRVPIEMRHVFSKVTIKATSGDLSGSPAISNVSATLVGYQAVIKDGVVGKGVAEDQTFANFPATPAASVYSVPRVVYAGNEDFTTIKINSATIGGTTHTGAVAKFNTKLLPGRSYTLSVRFDELVWAGSNIFWDNQKLTFYPAENTSNQGYQGVFFKFGSLIGISPAQTVVPASGGTMTNDFLASTPVYVPTYNALSPTSSTWVRNNNHSYTPAGWPLAAAGTAENGTANIPYLDGSYTSSDYTRNSTFVIDAERNTDAMYAARRGDICQYIGKTQLALKGYRLPTSSEFGTTQSDSFNPNTTVAGGWIWGRNFGTWPSYDNSIGNAEGTVNLIPNFGYATNQNMGVILPASGLRGSGGQTGFLGNFSGFRGHYWSGSAASDNYGFYLVFSENIMYVEQNYYRSYAQIVRCVRN